MRTSIVFILVASVSFGQTENASDSASRAVAQQRCTKAGPAVSAAASNLFMYGNGWQLSDINASSEEREKEWDYLYNSFDYSVSIGALWFAGRFVVEHPSYFPASSQSYREYLARRTLGLRWSATDIQVGTVNATIGRGLTMSLREDPTVNASTLLDGVMLKVDLSKIAFSALTGRHLLASQFVWSSTDGSQQTVIDNDAFQDAVRAAWIHYYPFSGSAPNPVFEGVSAGAGIVNYRSEVAKRLSYRCISSITNSDSLADTVFSSFVLQPKTELFLPVFMLSLPVSAWDLYVEYAHLVTRVSDAIPVAFDSVSSEAILWEPKEQLSSGGFAGYLSAGVTLGIVSVLGEYKCYWYGRGTMLWQRNGLKTMNTYADPPRARYKHSWELLTRHEPANKVTDSRGYGVTVTVTGPGTSTGILACNLGGPGRPGDDNILLFDRTRGYWELYGEWATSLASRYSITLGADYSKFDPDYPNDRLRMIAGKINAGPFRGRHGFSFSVEYGRPSRKLLGVEKDMSVVASKVEAAVGADTLAWYRDSLGLGYAILYDMFVPSPSRATYTQYVHDLVATLAYSFSPYLVLGATFGYSQSLHAGPALVRTDVTSRVRTYLSGMLSLRLAERHVLRIEYGSFSGGMKCALGNCYTMPPYRGLKVSLTSTL